MFSLDRDIVSVILISLDIGLPIVGLVVAVLGLAVVFHIKPAVSEPGSVNVALRRTLADTAAKTAGAMLEGREPERTTDVGAGSYHLPV